MNVTTEELRIYIETFHHCLKSVASEFLQPEHQRELFHVSLLPARITGYVSTQLGIAIEYEQADETSIQIVRGSARVEKLFVQAPSQANQGKPMCLINGPGISIAKLTIRGAGLPFHLIAPDASVTFHDVVFEIGSWTRMVQFAEVFADRKAENWSRGKAESRAKDEVLVAITQLKRAEEKQISISDYIKQYKDKTVLVLGNYNDECLSRLKSISTALSSLGYDPLLLKDIPDHPHLDLSQKLVAIGAISRFIMVDDSEKSGHLLEVQLCKQNSWVMVLLRAGGVGSSSMTAGAAHASNVIHEMAYDPASLDKAVTEAVQWAEAKLQELERKFEGTYPWRVDS